MKKEQTEPNLINYCLYARKSSEDDERQALSIDSQIKEMQAIAQRDGLIVKEIRRESHSAKDSGERSVYNQLVMDIEEGVFNGILTWAPDRLSRNAGDLGAIVDLMDQKKLLEIRTHGQTFKNSPNEKFLLMILCSQAKLENDNKSINVQRGLRTKCESGFRPGVAPLGYVTQRHYERGKSKVLIDTQRAPIVKKIFERVAYEGLSGRELLIWLREIDFRTRSGKQIPLSSIYRILRSDFYYGRFEYPQGSGNWYDASYEPIIDKDLFDKVQERLNNNINRHYSKHPAKEFAFTKMIKCGSCGWSITAEEKYKHLKNGKIYKYIYYHCGNKGAFPCKEPSIREEDLIEQLIDMVGKIDMNKTKTAKRLRKEVERQNEFNKMLGLDDRKLEVPKINARTYAKYVLQNGTIDEKRELMADIESEILLKNKQVYI